VETMFDKYNTPETAPVSAGEPVGKAKAKRQRILKKKEIRVLKNLAKAVRKHDKLMKQEAARRKAEEEAAAQTAKRKNGDDGKGFLNSFAKAICKALPQIVTAVVTGVLGFFFKRKSSGKALQAA